ncbi:hypothetical protein SEA_YUUY_10 [Microbacterium phage YuuY]|nr:hypothetical protein SEA_YUUY_10 [Microbacterium phage YuuY]
MSITMGQLASKFAAAASKTPSVAEESVRTLAQVGVGLVKREIQGMHAVDTGTMLNSTDAEKIGRATYLVGPSVDYAPYVALGTSRMAARPFHIAAAKKLAAQAGDLGFDTSKLGL